MSIVISTGELPKRYIAPFLASLDACVVQRLAWYSETPHGYPATDVKRPVYQYVTVVGHLKSSKLSCKPSTWSRNYYPGYDQRCTDWTGLLLVLDLVLMLRAGDGVVCQRKLVRIKRLYIE